MKIITDSKSPWRTPKQATDANGRAESIALEPRLTPVHDEESWWTKYATDTKREGFSRAVAARDVEMRGRSRAWRQQSTNFS